MGFTGLREQVRGAVRGVEAPYEQQLDPSWREQKGRWCHWGQ